MNIAEMMNKREPARGVLPVLPPHVLRDIETILKNNTTIERTPEGIEAAMRKYSPSYFATNDPEDMREAIRAGLKKYPNPIKPEPVEENLYYDNGEYRLGESLKDLYNISGEIRKLIDAGPDTWKADDVEAFLSLLVVSAGFEKAEVSGIMTGLNPGTWTAYTTEFKEKTLKEMYKQRERETRGPNAATDKELDAGNLSSVAGRGLIYSKLADEFLLRWPSVVLEGSGEIRTYKKGIYPESRNPHEVQTKILKLSEEFNLCFSPSHIKSAEDMLKLKCPVVDPATIEDFHKLPVKNGVLDVVTGDFMPHSADNVYFSKLPVSYEPGAKAPEMFLKALNKSLPEKEKQDLLQEIYGYCLYRSYDFRAVFFLLGNGDNGKAVFLNILEAMLGHENVSNLSPKDITHPRNDFTLYPLFGKMANIDGEAGKSKISESENLKKLSGRDTIQARTLREKPIFFKNYAKIIMALNKLPEVNDFSEGFKSRIQILNFSHIIPLSEQVAGLEDKIIEAGELPGVLNWSLAGLERLLKNKKFTGSKTSAQRGIEYDMKSNPISYFIGECIEEDKGGWLINTDLYGAYVKYAKREGLPELTKKEIRADFIRECGAVGIETFEKQTRYKVVENGKEVSKKGRGFMNVKIQEEENNATHGLIEDPKEHDREERKSGMMKDLNNYLKTEQKENGGIEDPEETGAGFLVKYPGYRELADLEEITGHVRKVKEGFTLPN